MPRLLVAHTRLLGTYAAYHPRHLVPLWQRHIRGFVAHTTSVPFGIASRHSNHASVDKRPGAALRLFCDERVDPGKFEGPHWTKSHKQFWCSLELATSNLNSACFNDSAIATLKARCSTFLIWYVMVAPSGHPRLVYANEIHLVGGKLYISFP